MKQAPSETLLLRVIIILFWVIAAIAWWATLWHVEAFASFGAELPLSTTLVRDGAKMGVPFAFAGLFSAVTFYAMFRHRHRALLISVWLLCIAIALSLVVMVGITAPITRPCGEIVPGWPAGLS